MLQNIGRLQVVQHGQVETERSDPDRLAVNVHTPDLVPQDRPECCSQFRRTRLLYQLFHAVTNNPPERLDQEDTGAARRVHNPRPLGEALIVQRLRKYELHQSGRGVVTSVVPLLIGLGAVELLVNTADKLYWDDVEPICVEEQIVGGVTEKKLAEPVQVFFLYGALLLIVH